MTRSIVINRAHSETRRSLLIANVISARCAQHVIIVRLRRYAGQIYRVSREYVVAKRRYGAPTPSGKIGKPCKFARGNTARRGNNEGGNGTTRTVSLQGKNATFARLKDTAKNKTTRDKRSIYAADNCLEF